MLKNDTLKNGTSRIGLYGSAPLPGDRGSYSNTVVRLKPKVIKPTFWTEVMTEVCFHNKPDQQDKGNVQRVAVSRFVFRIK